MATILQDQYILGHSQTETIDTVGEEIAINLTLVPQPAVNNGTVTGSVTDGTNPIVGAYVKIMDNSYNPISHTVTDSTGEYTFNSLQPNTLYYAYAYAPGMALTRSGQFTVNSTTPTDLSPIVLPTDPNATTSIIAGDLTDQTTSQPINGAVCFLYSLDPTTKAPTLLEITYTNSYGQFVFRGLNTTSGVQYNIVFTALGYEEDNVTTSISGSSQIIYLPNVTLQQNGVTSTGTVSGMITDQNGIVTGADVILYTVSTTGALTPIAFTKTDQNGVYLFFNVAQGNYLIKSNKMATTTVTV